jgi:hypothetical protein
MGEILTKVCSKCGEKKIFSEFHKDKKKSFGVSHVCKICKKKFDKKYKAENKEKRTVQHRIWASINKEKIRASQRKFDSKKRNAMNDRYIKGLLVARTSLSSYDIPDDLVEVKRIHLLIKREIWGRK